MKYYLIAGEPSGDLHGSHLIRAIRAEDPTAQFRVWGGDLMQEAGAELVKHYRELAFMGVVEVIKNLPTILRNQKSCQQDIADWKPDRLVLIDYSGFNLRIAKWAKPAGFDISYYISPQVWASRSGRVKQIKAYVDRMLVILPFEEAWYAERGVKATFVGHPLLDVVKEAETARLPRREERPDGSADELTVALLPGSRKQEITIGLPLMLAAAAQNPEHEYVIAGAPAQSLAFYNQIIASCTSAPLSIDGNSVARAPKNVRVLMNDTYNLLQSSHAAIVTSGTATLETALFGIPQVVVYKGNWVAYQVAKWMIANRIKYISLVNLVMDSPVVSELIQHDFNADNLAQHLEAIISGPAREQQLNDLQRLREKLGSGGAATRAAKQIVSAT